MKIHIVTLFPELFDSFLATSLLAKAKKNWILDFEFSNPRDFCFDKHQQVDDQVYGGGAGMLIKAQPVIDAVEHVISSFSSWKSAKNTQSNSTQQWKIVFPSPSVETFTQKTAYGLSKLDHIIFVCGRYEGIDYRFEEYMMAKYPSAFSKVSLGQFILLGGEIATMTMIEAVTRLVPGVIKEKESWQNESYNLKTGMNNLEFPQYTRPEEVYGLRVPEVLLTGNQEEIQQRRKNNEKSLDFMQ